MEVAKQAAWAEAGIIIADLKAALTDANQQLCKERAARDQLEEDMKQSFMRSVCAINLEVSCCCVCLIVLCCWCSSSTTAKQSRQLSLFVSELHQAHQLDINS